MLRHLDCERILAVSASARIAVQAAEEYTKAHRCVRLGNCRILGAGAPGGLPNGEIGLLGSMGYDHLGRRVDYEETLDQNLHPIDRG